MFMLPLFKFSMDYKSARGVKFFTFERCLNSSMDYKNPVTRKAFCWNLV